MFNGDTAIEIIKMYAESDVPPLFADASGIPTPNSNDKATAAQSYIALSALYRASKDYKKSLESCQQAEQLATEMSKTSLSWYFVGLAANDKAMTYLVMGDNENARKQMARSLKLVDGNAWKVDPAVANIASAVYQTSGRIEKQLGDRARKGSIAALKTS